MKQIFINLVVEDLAKSTIFYTQLGFSLNPLFTDENQKCLVWSDAIYLMLQSKEFSNSYLKKTSIDARNHQIPTFTLPVESKEKVDEMVEKGLKFGGIEPVPALKEPFMFLRSIEDLDGYLWGIMCLDLDKFQSTKIN